MTPVNTTINTRPHNPWREICAASIGNALEFYDLLIYGYFAIGIGKLFFPTDDPTTSLLLSIASFGISFVTRPLGAIILGSYADRAGRKASLTVSIALMMLGTAMIAFAPTYADRLSGTNDCCGCAHAAGLLYRGRVRCSHCIHG